jgi:hypothetical protein
MPIDAERALNAALLIALRAAPALDPELGAPARVYDEPPERPLYPHVLIGRAQSQPAGGELREGAEHAVTLTVVSRYGGAEEAQRVVAAIAARLHDAVLPLTDHRLVNLRVVFRDVFRAADWRSTYGVIRLRAVTEPLAS